MCSYAPLEILHAAGFTPVRLMQMGGDVTLANAHLPSFSCALARAVTERMLRGDLDFLHGVLFTHTCDTLQCLADIWRMAAPRFRVLNYSLPTVLAVSPRRAPGPNGDAAGARDYLLAELHRLAETLALEFDAPVRGDALRASIALYNEQRRLLAVLHARLGRLTAREWWPLTLSATLMPVEEHVRVLRSRLDEPGTAQDVRGGPTLLLTGALLDDPLIPQVIDELGGRVVGDDLCTGSRYWDTLVDEEQEPFAALAERYLRRAPCPCKHTTREARGERILSLVRNTGAQGVVLVLLKFCDPHAFDAVPLTRALDAADVPHVTLETDVSAPAGQVRTRLQAFLEMLQT